MDLTSVDVSYLVQELQAFERGRIEKISQSAENKRDLCITMYVKDLPKVHLRFVLPGLVCNQPEKPTYQMVPPGFAMFLRKYLNRATLARVEQLGFDRILKFSFSGKEDWMLIVEFIQPGNVLVLFPDGKIKGLLENQAFKDRALRGGIEYMLPPPSFDPRRDDVSAALTRSTKDSIVVTLATELGLGGAYAEEVCARAGVDKGAKLATKDRPKVEKALKELFSQKIVPCRDDARIYPFLMKSRETTPLKGTFLSSLAAFAEQTQAKEVKPKVVRDKLKTMLDAQEANIEKQEAIAVTEREKAEKIFEEYMLVEGILKTAQTAREKKQDIAKALEMHPQVKNYNAKTKEIELEL